MLTSWNVEPDATSVFVIGFIATDISIYQNSLSGDTVSDYLANSVGVNVGGLNVALDDNDISGMKNGFSYYAPGFGGGFSGGLGDSFNRYSRNSIHGCEIGFADGSSNKFGPTSWAVGNVYVDNLISGPNEPDPTGSLNFAAGISFWSQPSGILPSQYLMNIIDRDTVTGFSIALGFFYGSGEGIAGIQDTVLSYCFFSSNGATSDREIALCYAYPPDHNLDLDSYFLYSNTNNWQNFWLE